MKDSEDNPSVLLVLPLAYQDGRDKYAGFLHYVSERRPDWDIRLERERPTPARARQLMKERVDAVVLDGVLDASVCRSLSRAPVRVVLDVPDRSLFPSSEAATAFAEIDSGELGQRAGDYLLARSGTADMAFVGYAAASWSMRRRTAFMERLAVAGRVPKTLELPFHGEQSTTSRRNLLHLLAGLSRPAGVFAACDRLARWIVQTAGETGLSVPNDLAVLGVDNEDIICTHARPTLSSLQPDFTALGYEAARLLDRLLATGKPPATEIRVGGIRLVERESTAPAYSAAFLVAQAKDRIRHGPDRNPHVADVARALGVSRRLLDLRFREATGETVLDFMRREKLAQAKRLLAETDMPVGAVCEACGFRSVNHLKRIFRAETGFSMRAWRTAQSRPDPA